MNDLPGTSTRETSPPQGGLLGMADSVLTATETVLLCASFGIMIVLMFGQGVLSNIMDFEWPWAQRLALNMMVLATGAGASVAVREGRHVAIDALVRLLPVRARAALAAVVAALCVAACLWFMGPALAYVNLYRTDLRHMGVDMSLFGMRCAIPLWTTRLALPFTMGLLAARFALCGIGDLRTALGRGGEAKQ